ncbi:Cation-independent mannose-6-phosphate receptor CI-MPR [Conoideocrella luteorostrata]|uniref:Cation-independent mannose-6-phosphate receptor CI-MPR n=1 Tax=Conoideocrella luteorostrata TaxID=1105319 RepID=A0AAJ0CYL5_9HYPO|nr:Cation-independent mannose-6-phosphate receptor CI-MPR [Conoideocrella luteorostrata]
MRYSLFSAGVVAASLVGAKETSTTTHVPACTATASSGTGGFYDLRPIMAHPAEKDKQHKTGVTKDYHSRGYDYGKNFTLNVCGSVVDPVTDVKGVDKSAWGNVSAYYMSHGSVYSIGSSSMNLVSRGHMLVLQYTGGSPCGNTKSSKSSRSLSSSSATYNHGGKMSTLTGQPHVIESLQKEGDDKDNTKRKSTTISFICDRDPGSPRAAFSFVSVSPDECSYFFEARSVHACVGAEPHKPGSVGPGSVFGIILVVAFLVYVLGGVFYNRTVTNARGWRQLPNYSLWAGIWNFISDMAIILFSSCARCLPGRRGYSHLNTSPRRRNSDAENRLIDQLDEEWDD